MATLYVRNVPPDVYERLKERAGRHGRSLSAEALAIIRAAVLHDGEGIGAPDTTSE